MSYLVLETGEIFSGKHLGGGERAGEVVFNTAHHGYEEIATDPSYFSQIVVMTAPHQGNYGENDVDKESDQIWIEGLICVQMQSSARDSSWMKKLKQRHVPILEGVDTRQVVLTLREKGSVYGAVVQAEDKEQALEKAKKLIQKSLEKEKDWPYLISSVKAYDIQGKAPEGPRIGVLDFGCKKNILRELVQRSSVVRVFPPRTSVEEIKNFKPQGLLLSNGPGNPEDVQTAVSTIQTLLGHYFMFGICMGCQLLALALGGKTRKLKFGHRGANHPVKDLLEGCIYVTSQNHGYVVVEGSLPEDVQITHINLNDQTIQGFFSKSRKLLGVQFHPENCPGPQDAHFLFDRFVNYLK